MKREDLNLNVLLHGLTLVTNSKTTNVRIRIIGEMLDMEGNKQIIVERTCSNRKNLTKKLGRVKDLEDIRKLFPKTFETKEIDDVERLALIKEPLTDNSLSDDLKLFHQEEITSKE